MWRKEFQEQASLSQGIPFFFYSTPKLRASQETETTVQVGREYKDKDDVFPFFLFS